MITSKKKSILMMVTLLSLCSVSVAGIVDTISIYSYKMHKNISCVIIRPNSYKKKIIHFPVVYLLHGFDGSYNNWIKQVPEINEYADRYQSIIVCPDGATDSWYFDSPVDTAYRYETYIALEVVHYIDQNYRTIADRKHRAICGLSMGGHGALFLALRHPDTFGAAGSMSGGVDLSQSKNLFALIKRIGDTTVNAREWHDLTIINLIEHFTNTSVKIIFDCGNKDFFIDGNRMLHRKMSELNIPHDFIERPGEHSWEYWKNALPYHLLFFRRFFDS